MTFTVPIDTRLLAELLLVFILPFSAAFIVGNIAHWISAMQDRCEHCNQKFTGPPIRTFTAMCRVFIILFCFALAVFAMRHLGGIVMYGEPQEDPKEVVD